MLNLLRANWKRALTIAIWTVVGLNVVFFVQRMVWSGYCDAEKIIRRHRADQDAAASSDFDGCTFARGDNESVLSDPPETNWCMYNDTVDLRIIILTFNRRASLLRLLRFVVHRVFKIISLTSVNKNF